MSYFTNFQERLFSTAELSKVKKEKIDKYLKLLDDSGVGEIIHKEIHIIHIDYLSLSYTPFLNILEV